MRVTRFCGLFAALVSSAVLMAAPAAQGAMVGVPTNCAEPTPPGYAHCNSEVLVSTTTDEPVQPNSHLGLGPGDLQSAYGLAGAAAVRGTDQTVAVVDAFDNPNAESDLARYRSEYGLPQCTTANGCFRKTNQYGGTTPPRTPVPQDGDWTLEISLDLDVVSATCPRCHILLVEANSASFIDLAAAVDRAAILGATQITNSYGGSEIGTSSIASHYSHAGVAITASSGDSGFAAGPEAPAAFPSVTAVGGTTLCRSGTEACPASTRGWSESVWSLGGSGCSTRFAKPAWQHDVGCTKRTIADVSAVADPLTGVAVYNTYGGGSWMVVGGTSASSPLVAAYYALVGSDIGGTGASWAYAHPERLFDVTSGLNGVCGITTTYFCTAVSGYDGPTGLGTPNGTPVTNDPDNMELPAILGTAQDGAALTCSDGSWTGSPTGFARQWTRDGSNIVGATGSAYTVTAADVSRLLACRVSATNASGTHTATSDAVTPVVAPSASGSTGNTGTTGATGTTGNTGNTGTSSPGGETPIAGSPVSGAPGTGAETGVASGGGSGGSGGEGGGGASGGGSSGDGAAAAALALNVESRGATLNRSGRGRIPVHCDGPARSTCQVRFMLQTRAGKGKHLRRVGAGSGQVAAGDGAMLAFALNRTGRTLLGRAGRLAVTVSGTARAGTSELAFSEPLRLTLRARRAPRAAARQGG